MSELERLAEISRETIILVTKSKPVKPSTLRALTVSMDEYDKRKLVRHDPFHADTIKELPDLKELRGLLNPKKERKHVALLNKRIARLEKMVCLGARA